MKFPNIIFYILLVVSLLFSRCTNNNKKIIDKDEFINILVDLHIFDAVLANRGYYDGNLKDSAKSYYNYIFKKYNISRATFDNSLTYYNQNGNDYLKMYDQVVSKIAERVPSTLHEKSIYAFIPKLIEDAKNMSNLKAYYGVSGKTIWKIYTEGEIPKDTAKIPTLFTAELKYPCKLEFSCELKIDSTNICNDMNIQMQLEYRDKTKQRDTVQIHYVGDKWKTYKLNIIANSTKLPKSVSINLTNCKKDKKIVPKFAIKNILLKQFAIEK